MPNGFSAFWQKYPRRVGKLAAMRAFAKALKVSPAADILAGVERYIEHKPDYADWAHPSSWLNAGRWMDEYEDRRVQERRHGDRRHRERRTEPTHYTSFDCPHQPPCNGRRECHTKSEMAAYLERDREAS